MQFGHQPEQMMDQKDGFRPLTLIAISEWVLRLLQEGVLRLLDFRYHR